MSKNMVATKKNDAVLETVKLDKIFKFDGREVRALSDVNLQIKKGDFMSIMGPSGSGKTTLLNMLGCLDRPTHGKVILEGLDLTKIPEKDLYKVRRDKVGFIFQTFNSCYNGKLCTCPCIIKIITIHFGASIIRHKEIKHFVTRNRIIVHYFFDKTGCRRILAYIA